MTFQEIQEKLKKCELALTSIKDGSYSNTKYTKEEALEKFNTIKESLEKKLNLLKEEETMFVSTKGGDTKAVSMDTKAAMDLKKDPNITGITTAKGKDLKEDDLSDEEQEEITTETSHTEVVAKEVHKAFIDALQETGHEVSEHNISSLNPETFTLTVKFKNNTQSDYSFEFEGNEVKLDGNILVTTNKKGVTPVLNKTIAKDNSIKYLQNLAEELDAVGKEDDDINNDGKVDSTDKYLKKRRDAISKNIKEDESEPVVDKKGKYTGVRRLKLSDKDKETLKKIEDLLAKEKSLNEKMTYKDRKLSHEEVDRLDLIAHKEFGGKDFSQLSDEDKEKVFAKRDKVGVKETKGAPKGHYFTKSGNLVKGRLTKDARERGARLSDPKDKQRSKVPPVTQYNEQEVKHYLKLSARDYKRGIEAIERNIDGNFTKIDIVDDDGAGNVIVYFHGEDAGHVVYDAVMDLRSIGIDVVDSTADLFQEVGMNDPVLMRSRVAKMRADDMKKLDALKKANVGSSRKEIQARALVQKLKAKRAEIEREMENDPDIEPTGGPVADMYGDQLNKIDNAIEKAASVYNKPMDYDTAVGKVEESKIDYDFSEGEIKRVLKLLKRGASTEIGMIKAFEKALGRELTDDEVRGYSIDPNKVGKASMEEDLDVGHVDDEPGMLKQDAYEIAQYSIQLFKLLKHYESLDVEVDFPNWWQRKVMLARDYISKATHYLDFKTNEPAIDSQAAALQEDEEPTKADLAKEKSLAKKSALLQFIASMQKKGIVDKDKKVLDKDAYKKEHDAFKKNVKEGRNLNELSGDQTDALYELQNILDDAASLGEQARDIIRQSFPKMLSKADAYGAFDLGSSANRYDTTLASIIEEIEEYYDEEEDLDEIGMFHDPVGYRKSKPEPEVFDKKYVAKDTYDILKHGKKLMTFFGSEGEANAYINKRNRELTGEGKYKSDAQRKAIYATKAKKENQDRSWSREDMETYIDETLGGYLERYLGYNPGPPNHPIYKMSHDQFAAYIAQEFIGGLDELMDEVDTSIEFLRDVIEDAYQERKKIAMGVGHDPDMHFEPEEEKIGADALGLVLKTLDKMATPTKLESKAKKGELKEEMDGGRLFDYFNSKGYDITERSSDGRKPGFEGYMVSRGEGRAPQSVIFQYNKDTDKFTISRMSGYRIDEKEAIKAGMREAGRSGVAGIDSYMTDGNYTPVDISAEGLKDIVDHVMSGLDRESKAQSDFYKDRGRTSGTIDEGATCCGRCGRVHVKGSGCKRPYLKGKSHCRNK